MENNNLTQIFTFLIIVAAFIVLSFILMFIIEKFIKKLIRKTMTELDNLIVAAMKKPLIMFIIILGIYVASKFILLSEGVRFWTDRGFSIAISLFAIYIVVSLINTAMSWYQSELRHKMQLGIEERIISLIKMALPSTAAFLGIVLVLNIIGLNVSFINVWLAQHGIKIGLIIAVTFITTLVMGQAVPRIMESAVTRGRLLKLEDEAKKRADTLSRVLLTALQGIIVLIALFMILSEIQIDIGPILAGAGVFGLAIGFGAQNLVRDILAGLFIIMENQYRVGDVVKIADISGLVEDINLRRTVLRDMDGIVHTIPNGEIKTASNFTRGFSRVNMNISVSYNENLDKVIKVINQVCQEMADEPRWKPYIIKTPQVLRVDNLGESGIDIKILGDTRPLSQWDIMGEIRKRIKAAFDREGIEIPWPHTKIYFGNPLVINELVEKSKKTEREAGQ